MIAADIYKTWIATLSPEDRELALAAGLDKPPPDHLEGSISHADYSVRDADGLETVLVNGSKRPRVDEATRTGDDDVAVVGDAAEALRSLLQWVVGNHCAEAIGARPSVVALRVFAIGRALQLNNFAAVPLATYARAANVTRAAVSKCVCQFADHFANARLVPYVRPGVRATMRAATREAWRRRRGALKKKQGR